MQTKSVSLHFMVFIKGPARGAGGKMKEKKRIETAGVKTPTKNFTAELKKLAEVMKNSQRTHITNLCSTALSLLINLILVSHNYGRVPRCVRTLHRVILLTFLISEPVKQNHKNNYLVRVPQHPRNKCIKFIQKYNLR